MIRLDDNLLQELGLGTLPPEEKDKFLKHIYETLEMRVGTRLAERMTDQQLDEFENFIDRKDDAGAFHWLETNFPNYKEVVAEEFEKLKTEIKTVSQDILAASASQLAAAGSEGGQATTQLPPQPSQTSTPPLPQAPPVDSPSPQPPNSPQPPSY
jgi:Protein of unknown function (DUF5663)